MSDWLPKVSIARLRSLGAAREQELIKLRQAGEGVGFFLVTDYEEDITQELEERTFDQARALFSLPPASLRRIALDRSVDPSNRGYEGLGAQSLDPRVPSGSGDLNHSWRGTEDRDPHLDSFIPSPRPAWAGSYNQDVKWPSEDELPHFQSTMLSYLRGNWKTAETIFGGIEEAFDMPQGHIRSKRTKPLDTLRLLWYPKMTAMKKGQVACGFHTDFGTKTIVRRRGKGSLQVALRDGKIIDVRPPVGCAIVNFGDMLQWWTEGLIKSTPHGVNTGDDDISLVVFCYADPWQELVDGKTAGDYQREKIVESYRHVIPSTETPETSRRPPLEV
jgi:isopenicillin N synthase-like dioxygenase